MILMIHPHHLGVHHHQPYPRLRRRSRSAPGQDHVTDTRRSITRERVRLPPRRTAAELKAPSARSSVAGQGHVTARSGGRATSINLRLIKVDFTMIMKEMRKLPLVKRNCSSKCESFPETDLL